MVCGKCGANLADGTQFCTVCGNSLDAKPAAPAMQTNYYAPVVRSGGSSVLGIILMIVGAVIAVNWIAYFVYGLVTSMSYGSSVDIWMVITNLFNGLSPGLILICIGAVLNKLAKR